MNQKRPDLPYEKAAEETAKTVGKGLDLVNRAAPAIGDAYGFLIGDRIKERRTRNADRMARETKRILDQRKLEETRPLPEDLAAPLLEAAQRDPRDELLKLYATLAANAMDPGFEDHVRPEFVETIRKCQPMEIRLMQLAATRRRNNVPWFSQDDAMTVLGATRDTAVHVSIDQLKTLNCIKANKNGYALSAYGSELLRVASES